MKKSNTIELREDNYYQVYIIQDRLREALIKKFGNLSNAAKKTGKRPNILYQNTSIASVLSVYKFCEQADINLEYILTGKNKAPFTPVDITYKNYLKEYAIRQKRTIPSEQQLVFKLRHNLIKSVSLLTLLNLTKQYHKDMYYLITG